MFVDGEFEGYPTGNASDLEIRSWMKLVKKINPKRVDIYTLEREAPLKCLKKVTEQKLVEIESLMNRLGIATEYHF